MRYWNYCSKLLFVFTLLVGSLSPICLFAQNTNSLPNILWLTSEDNGPHLGCYGDEYADTPHIDSLAKKGMIYLNAWSTAPVCAPARTTLITGMYPPCTGSQHMRSLVKLPSDIKLYPQLLREQGYYCTNNRKEDYNIIKQGKVWDESGPRAHWKNRPAGKPFFAVFNYTVSHESQLRKRPHKAIHDPAQVRIPPYHPDAPEIRQDWAQYYDKLTEMDLMVGKALNQLEKDGLSEETIIFYYGDHGSGMPRNKRWLYQSGLRVPLVVHFPEKFKHLAPKEYQASGKSERLVGFVDYAPTLLSIAGVTPPQIMQGISFSGKFEKPEPEYIFGFRDRMDERYDISRTVRDKRYHYIRNYMPHRPQGQYLGYMFKTPTTRKWKELFDSHQLNKAQSVFWEAKPLEELFDLENDPDEINNLANSSKYQLIQNRLKNQLTQHILEIRDTGFLPEAEIHLRSKQSTPYEMAQNKSLYPLEEILKMAEVATSLRGNGVGALVNILSSLQKGLKHEESAVRYWAAIGLLNLEDFGYDGCREVLVKLLDDSSASVQVVVAEILIRYGTKEESRKAIEKLLELANFEHHHYYESLAALNVLVYFNDQIKPYRAVIEALPRINNAVPRRINNYVERMINKIIEDFASGSQGQ